MTALLRIIDRVGTDPTDLRSDKAAPKEMSRKDIEDWALLTVHDTLDNATPEPGRILSIYGMGGEGKTHLLERLRHRLADEDDPRAVVVFHSFDDYQAAPVERTLKDLAMLLAHKGIPCPGFLMTYYVYRSLKSNPQKALSEFEDDYRNLSPSSPINTILQMADFSAPFVDAVFGVHGVPVPIGGVLDAAIDLLGNAAIERRKRVAMKRWQQVERLSTSSELYSQLIPMLVQDLESWLDGNPRRRVIALFDTFERLGAEADGRFGRYEWAQALTRTPGTLWIIAGRAKVSWENTIPYPAHMVDMNEEEADELLINAGVTDSGVREEIKRLTRCLPVYLALCAHQYELHPDEALTGLDLSGTREELLESFLRYTRDDNRKLVYAAAFLEHWDDELIESVVDSLSLEADTRFLSGLSYVTRRGDTYEMHEVVADVLRNSTSIRQLKRRLYDLTGSMLPTLRSDSSIPEGARARKVMRLLRVRCRLLDAGVGRVPDGEAFATYMEYAECVWEYGDIDVAMGLFRAIEDGFGSDKEPTREYLRAKLKVGALSTQFYLAGCGCEYHAHAIVLAEEVLEQARSHFPDDEALIQNALNDLGVSWARFKEFRKALEYQGELYRMVEQKGADGLTLDEARFANNYGSTCQLYGDSLESLPEKGAQYSLAAKAYDLSLRARRHLVGEDSSPSLISQTNLGVIRARLGDYEGGRSIVGDARRRYERAGFDRSTPGFLRCDYQLAMFDEQEAMQLMESDPIRARELALSALRRHREVCEARANYLSPMSMDARKSAEQVRVCEELLRKLDE